MNVLPSQRGKSLSKLTLVLVILLLSSTAQAGSIVYDGNGNTGFGGVFSGVGALELSDDTTTISGKLTRGTGNFNDFLVIYIDSVGGGVGGTSTLTDTADDHRRAISGTNANGSADVTFPAGFAADYAIALSTNVGAFGGLWETTPTNNFDFVDAVNLSPLSDTAAAMYTFDFDISEIGINPGDSFDFVTTYLNPNDGGGPFRSDEAIGDGIAAGNPGQNAVTFTGARTYVTMVPEPTALALVWMGLLALLGSGRRTD